MGMNAKFKVDSHFSNAYPFIHFSLSIKLLVLKVLPGEIPDEYDP